MREARFQPSRSRETTSAPSRWLREMAAREPSTLECRARSEVRSKTQPSLAAQSIFCARRHGGQRCVRIRLCAEQNPNDYGKVVASGGAGGSGGSISGLIVSGLGVESLNISAGAGGPGVMAFKSGLGGKVSGINAVLAANGSAFIKGGWR